MAGQTIDRVQVEIEASAKGVSNVFKQLESQMNTLKAALASVDTSKLSALSKVNTSGMSKAERDISSSVNKIKQSLAGLESYKNAAMNGDSSSMTSFSRRVISIQSQIDVLGEKLRQLGDNRTGVSIDTDAFQTYREQLAEVQSALTETQNQVTSTVNAMNNTQPDDNTSNLSEGLTRIANNATTAYTNMLKLTGSTIASGLSRLRSAITGIGSGLSSIGKSTKGGVSTGFKQILKYAFGIRSLYVLFRRLRKAIVASFTELQKSGAFFQTTKANVEGLKTALTTLKYQFGAAFEPIFNTVAPALQTLINYLVTVMNTISAFIAKLTGKSTYSKAVASTAAIASNTGSAAGSAKELNKQLQGFDELNNLDLDSGSSGGGGGGGSSDSSNVEYVEENVDNALTSFWDTLSDYILAGDWYMVGNTISTALTNALNSINWDSIYNTVSGWGTNLATFMNGLITPDLFSAVGTTIGNSLNTALTFLNSFGTTFDWSNFGQSIASGINAFIKTNPLQLAVETFNTWANGILTTLIEAVNGVSWKDLAQNIADAIGSVDAKGISFKLGKLVTAIANAAKDLLANKNTWTNLGTKIADGINGFFEGFDGASVAYMLNNLISGIESMIFTALKKVKWSEIGKDIVEFIGNLDLGNIALVIGGLTLANAAKTYLATAIPALLSKECMSVVGSMGTVSVGTVAISVIASATIGWKIGTKLYESASGHEVKQGFIDQMKDIWDGFANDKVSFNLLDFIEFTVEDATGWYGTYRDWVYDLIDQFTEDFKTLKNSLSVAWKNVWYGNGTGVARGYNGAPSDAVNYIESNTTTDLEEKGANLWNGIYNGFNKAMTLTNPISTQITLLKTLISKAFGSIFGEHSPATAMYPHGENLFKGIIEGFKQAMNSFNFDSLLNELKNKFSLDNVFNNSSSTAVGVANDLVNMITSGDSTTTKTVKIKTKYTGEVTSKTDLTDQKTKWDELTDAASKSTDAVYKTTVGGGISRISDLDTWRSTFRNLYNTWKGKTATMVTTEDGLENSSGWISRLNDLRNEWKKENAPASFSTKANVDAVKNTQAKLKEQADQWKKKGQTASFNTKANITNVNDGLKKLSNASTSWKNYSATATFNTQLTGAATTASGLADVGNAVKNITSNWSGGSHSADFSIKTYVDESSLNNAMNQITGGDHWVEIKPWVDTGQINAVADKIKSKLNNAFQVAFQVTSVDVAKALGGVYSGGSWHDLPQYASGTLNAGSVFVAGERGPELMGHINGRTEILNRSQIASTMRASIIDAMGQFKHAQMVSPPSIESYNTESFRQQQYTSDSRQINAIMEQNELLRQQNELLQEIASKNVTISSREVFNAVRSESNNYYNRTGNSPFIN